jgi:hypothetical protein
MVEKWRELCEQAEREHNPFGKFVQRVLEFLDKEERVEEEC